VRRAKFPYPLISYERPVRSNLLRLQPEGRWLSSDRKTGGFLAFVLAQQRDGERIALFLPIARIEVGALTDPSAVHALQSAGTALGKSVRTLKASRLWAFVEATRGVCGTAHRRCAGWASQCSATRTDAAEGWPLIAAGCACGPLRHRADRRTAGLGMTGTSNTRTRS
jgi:hypothetical protein